MATRQFTIKDEKVATNDELFCEAQADLFNAYILSLKESGEKEAEAEITEEDRKGFVELKLKAFYLDNAKTAYIERQRKLAVEEAEQVNLD